MNNLKPNFHYNLHTKKAEVSVSGKLCALGAKEFKSSLLRFCIQIPSDLNIDVTGVEKADLTGVNSLAIVFS